jgi:hypothetical protein
MDHSVAHSSLVPKYLNLQRCPRNQHLADQVCHVVGLPGAGILESFEISDGPGGKVASESSDFDQFLKLSVRPVRFFGNFHAPPCPVSNRSGGSSSGYS